jgi:hypothetical protein
VTESVQFVDESGVTRLSGTSVGGPLREATADISSAEVLTLKTVGVELVPGLPETLLYPVSILTQMIGGAAGYTLAGDLNLQSGAVSATGTFGFNLPNLTTAITQGPPGWFAIDALSGATGNTEPPNTAVGQGIYLVALTGDPTVGDMALQVRVLYTVCDVA